MWAESADSLHNPLILILYIPLSWKHGELALSAEVTFYLPLSQCIQDVNEWYVPLAGNINTWMKTSRIFLRILFINFCSHKYLCFAVFCTLTATTTNSTSTLSSRKVGRIQIHFTQLGKSTYHKGLLSTWVKLAHIPMTQPTL